MKKIKYLFFSAMVLFAGCVTSCQQEDTVAKAVLVSESLLDIAAENPEDVTVTVYSDGEWRTEAPEWVTVTPSAGTGTMEVVLSFQDNVRDGAIDNPRKADVLFRGDRLMSIAKLLVRQDGDKFRDLTATSFTDLAALPLESFVMIEDALVVAVAANGFLASSADTHVFVECAESIPSAGDKVSFYAYTDVLHSFVSLTDVERLEVNSSSNAVDYAENDITATFDGFTPSAISYVTLEGILNGTTLNVNDAQTATCVLENPSEELGISSLNGHKVRMSGFVLGKETTTVYLLPVGPIVDNGVDEIICFSDNFDWVQPFVEADPGAVQGDSMLDNAQYTVSSSYNIPGFEQKLTELGYEALFPASKAIYVMTGNYLKFSKGKNTNGIRLPAMDYAGASSVILTFDWGVNIGEKGPDAVELEVVVEGNGTVDAGPFKHTAGDWEWQKETITISGIDANTRITIRPTVFSGVVDSGYYRWFLDNVKVVAGEGGGAPVSGSVVFEENFDWLTPITTAETAGDAVGTDNPSASAPNVWKMATSSDFFAKFNELGYQYLYGKVGSTEFVAGPAQEPNAEVGKDGSMYIQADYLKFGQTSYNGALRLPALSSLRGTANLTIEFDWCWQVTGAFKPDIMTVSVDATVGQFPDSGMSTSLPFDSTQSKVDTESHIAWQHVSVVLNNATSETVLTIRPTNADPDVENAARHQNRWYLDNIKVTVN